VDGSAREPHPVAEVPTLLGRSGVLAAVSHRRRHLGEAVPVQSGADHQLGGLVLALLERHSSREVGAHRADPACGVGDPVANDDAEHDSEHEHAQVANLVGGELRAAPA